MRIDEILGGVKFFESVITEILQDTNDDYFDSRKNEEDIDDIFEDVVGGEKSDDDIFEDYTITAEHSDDDIFSDVDEDDTYGGAADYISSLVKSYNNYGS